MGKVKICFVSLGIYPFLYDRWDGEIVGGSEFQQVQIGQALHSRGFDVSYITLEKDAAEPRSIRGITVIPCFREEDGFPGLRYFHPRLSGIWTALKRADADVYYCRAAGFLPGILALFCRRYRKRFVYAGAHDSDFIPGCELIRFGRDRLLFRFGIRRATSIFVQSRKQQHLLEKHYQLQSTIIRNFLHCDPREPAHEGRKVVLYVATMRPRKRPLDFVSLARDFPEEDFVMIGGRDGANPSLYDEVAGQCAGLPNISFLGFQPSHATETHFDRAKIFVNTSEAEGFPNTFLQAWRRGIPVVSHLDPDDIIRSNRLGRIAAGREDLSPALAEMLDTYGACRDRIISYFMDHHSTGVVEEYCRVFTTLLDGSEGGGS